MTDAADGSPRRIKPVWLVVAAGAALLLVATVYLIVSVAQSRESPTSALEAYLAAARDRDRVGVDAAVCAGDGNEIRTLLGIVDDSDELVEWRMISETVAGDRAEVSASVTFANQGEMRPAAALFTLQREDSEWKVCSVRQAGGPAD